MRWLTQPARSLARSAGVLSYSSVRVLNDDVKRMLGSLEAKLQPTDPGAPFPSVEFRVFSQFGEDGIIQHLLRHVAIDADSFVEIGVESYRESNTRFLLEHDNWEGVIIDAGTDHIKFLNQSGLRWRHTVHPVSTFVEPAAVNSLLRTAGVPSAPGLLSIDIDGVDYWVLDQLDFQPSIVVAEYNSHFGPTAAVTVPYIPRFNRTQAHFSNLYFGASLGALNHWAIARGYGLIGCNSGGNNAFFVRKELAGRLPSPTVDQAYVPTRVREAKDRAGRLTYRRDEVFNDPTFRELPLVDLETGDGLVVSDVLG